MALFTRMARRGVSVAGGEVSPSCGAVPATAMVTTAAADGAVLSSSGSAREEEAEGLQEDIVSMAYINVWQYNKATISTRKIRLLALSASALSDDLVAPVAKRRSTPRQARRSYPDVFLLQLPPPPGSSHLLWTRCCVEPQQGEPSSPQQRH
jgi:hypothetical protein